jgi:hypothetical protein
MNMKLMEKDRRKLEREAQRLIAEGKMPSFEELVAVIAEVREKYRPLILAARKERNESES